MSSETRLAHHPLDSKEYVSRLNHDVLSEVFMLNTDFDFDTPHIPSRTIRHISQVSTRWRNIILRSPMIWASSLDFSGKSEWIQTVLDRAKDAPLNVVYPPFSSQLLSNQTTLSEWRHLEHEDILALVHKTWHGPINIDKLDMALSLFSRSRRFRLFLYNDKEWEYAKTKCISMAAPHLEELIVEVIAQKSRDPHNGGLSPQSTIFDLSISCKQNLKTLHLSGYGLKPPAFESDTLLNLTTLVIQGLEDDKTLTGEEWLAILSFSPHLEVLHFDDCFSSLILDNLAPGQPISLPRLRSLKLQGFYVGVSTIFCRIEVPSSCAIDVRFRGAQNTAYTPLISTTFSLIQQKIQKFIALQPIVDMSLFLKRYPGLAWKFYNNIHSAGETPFCVGWRPQEMADSRPFFPPLKQILDIISPNLTSLYLDTAKVRQGDPSYQVGLLEAFKAVEFLSIQNSNTLEFIEMQFNDNQPATQDTPLLPSLELILFNYLFIGPKDKRKIYTIFAGRLESGTPIAKCRLKDCSGPALQELVNDLRGLGVDVEWNERIDGGGVGGGDADDEGNYDMPILGDDEDSDWETADEERDFDNFYKPPLGPLAIQSARDGSYRVDSDDLYDSDDMFDSD